ncbi:MAG: nuclear transport factor 2 family protein [Gammaproteobacteria bacterium]|nr:nuclear transport factor 2 family protein [Gammaproteobacteria bacterium]
MLDRRFAVDFAQEWIDAWNAHDLDRILAHYADDFTMSSPLVIERLGRDDGTIRGKEALAEYWRPSLSLEPPLVFELVDVLVGIDQMTIYYRNVGRRVVAETLTFDHARRAVAGSSQWSALREEGGAEP